MMFTVSGKRGIHAPHTEVWALLGDFAGHYRFNPYVESCPMTTPEPVGIGAERQVRMYDGSIMYQRIMDYEANRSLIIEVVESDLFIRHLIIRFVVEPRGTSRCRLTYRITYRAPGGWLSYPIGWLFKPIVRSRYNQVLRGIEQYLRTGEIIGNQVAI